MWRVYVCSFSCLTMAASLALHHPKPRAEFSSYLDAIEKLTHSRLVVTLVFEDRKNDVGQQDSALVPPAVLEYPINALRNAAVAASPSDLVLLLDVDQVPCPCLQKFLHLPRNFEFFSRRCRQEKCVFAVPSFELLADGGSSAASPVVHNPDPDGEFEGDLLVDVTTGEAVVKEHKAREDSDPHAFHRRLVRRPDLPASHSALRRRVEAGGARVFCSDIFPAGHGPTNSQRFLRSVSRSPSSSQSGRHREQAGGFESQIQPSEPLVPYQVLYEPKYEPYLLFSRSASPPFDERFRGYGYN
jgi:hypothetical protein